MCYFHLFVVPDELKLQRGRDEMSVHEETYGEYAEVCVWTYDRPTTHISLALVSTRKYSMTTVAMMTTMTSLSKRVIGWRDVMNLVGIGLERNLPV